MLKKTATAAAIAATLILAPAGVAFATPLPSLPNGVQEPYAGQETQSNTVAPGATVTFTSDQTNLLPGTEIEITVDGPTTVEFTTAVLSTSTTTVGADGTFSFGVQIPASAATGSVYTGVAEGGDQADNTYVLNFTINVAAVDDDAAGGDELQVTGAADTGALIWFGLGALALGVAAVSVVAVKRRQTV